MTDIDMNCSIELNDITDIIFAVIDDYYDGDIDEKTAFTDLLDDLEPYAFRVDYDDLTCIALKRELLISIEDDLPFGIDLDIHPDYSIGAILHSLVSFVSQTESEHSTINSVFELIRNFAVAVSKRIWYPTTEDVIEERNVDCFNYMRRLLMLVIDARDDFIRALNTEFDDGDVFELGTDEAHDQMDALELLSRIYRRRLRDITPLRTPEALGAMEEELCGRRISGVVSRSVRIPHPMNPIEDVATAIKLENVLSGIANISTDPNLKLMTLDNIIEALAEIVNETAEPLMLEVAKIESNHPYHDIRATLSTVKPFLAGSKRI